MNRFMIGSGSERYVDGSNEVIYSNGNPPNVKTINICEWDDSLRNKKLKIDYYTLDSQEGRQDGSNVWQLDNNGYFHLNGNQISEGITISRVGNYLQWSGDWGYGGQILMGIIIKNMVIIM
nr:MAG TPA: hypothetical protein [Bacteriophage sp.]